MKDKVMAAAAYISSVLGAGDDMICLSSLPEQGFLDELVDEAAKLYSVNKEEYHQISYFMYRNLNKWGQNFFRRRVKRHLGTIEWSAKITGIAR